jgi:hypothetical protein
MKRVFCTLFLTFAAAGFAVAQNTSDYKKTEFYVGYSNGQIERGGSSGNFFNDRSTFHGWEGAGVYNFSRYFGVKADVSGTYRSQDFTNNFTTLPGGNVTISGTSKGSVYNVLGGIQVKDNSVEKRFKPFAHALIGVAHLRSSTTNFTCSPAASCTVLVPPSSAANTDTQFAGAFGGGLDIKVNDRFDIRAIQVDYNPVFVSGGAINNVRIGVGLVIK